MWVYKNLNPLGKVTGDCVVRACAFALGQSWDDTYNDLCDIGYDRKEMPSWNSTWWAYLKERGFSRHVIPDTCPDCYQVKDFASDHPQGTYVLFIPYSSDNSGHAVAVRDGNWYDTWQSGFEIPLVYWTKGGLR